MLSRTLCLLPPSLKGAKKQKDKEVSIYSGVFFICLHFGESVAVGFVCKLACVCLHGCLSHVASPKSSHPPGGRTASLSRWWFHFPVLLTSPAVLPIVPTLIPCNLKRPGLQLKHTIYTFAGVFSGTVHICFP